ncbi:MAG: hypothetical protein WCJ64_03375 [Rhodospirillaceae bacterium]
MANDEPDQTDEDDEPEHVDGDPELDHVDPAILARLRQGAGLDVLTPGELESWARLNAKPKTARQIKAAMKRRDAVAIKQATDSYKPGLKPPPYSGPPVRMGFDAEWTTWPAGNGWENEVLCLTAVVGCGGRTSRYMYVPEGSERKHRPTMEQFIQGALKQAMRDGVVRGVPDEIVCYGHFLRGDVTSFRDFWNMRAEFKGLGKTVASRPAGHAVGLEEVVGADDTDVGEVGPTVPDDGDVGRSYSTSRQIPLRSLSGRRFKVRVRFVDTLKLTPGSSKSLAAAALLVGTKKLDLHADLEVPRGPAEERPEKVGQGLAAEYSKARMDLIMRDHREAFDAYAYQDAKIALEVGLFFEEFARKELGLRRTPTTIAGASCSLQTSLAGGRAAVARLVGREVRKVKRFDEKRRRYTSAKAELLPTPGLEIYYQLACNAFHGGRNECYWHGPTPRGVWYDFDLPGAYPCVMANLRPLAYERAYQEFDPDAYGIDDMGVCWVEFSFPEGTRFPCLPVRTESGALVFPLRAHAADRVFVASPEVFLARKMNASVKIIQGIKVPWASDEYIFEKLTHLVQTKRKQYPKETHEALNSMWKELGNSTYGLTAQGLKAKRVFDPSTLSTQALKLSPLSEPFFAAWVTSCIRAILGEILYGVPASATVVSATTDGLLIDAPLEQLNLEGPLCKYFASIRERLFGDKLVLDPKPKHRAEQIISITTRMTMTARRFGTSKPVCAKGGIKFDCASRHENLRMVKLYLGYHHGLEIEHEELISSREQFTHALDLVGVKRKRRIRLRYDYRRRPTEARMVAIGRKSERVAFDTRPWETVSDAEEARALVETWERSNERVVRTLDDFLDCESHITVASAARRASAAAGVRTRQVNDDRGVGLLRRQFLLAGRRGEWGIRFEPRSMSKVAKALTDRGFQVSADDIKNSGRKNLELVPHCVAALPETIAALRVILQMFPDFDFRMAFREADAEKIEAELAATTEAESDTMPTV